jgi:hypothetical protein
MGTAGSIVVDLLLRSGSFATDTDRASKQFKKLKKEAQEAGKVIGTAIAAGATAAVAALQLTINSMDDMSKAAQKVGASTEEFSKLTYAAGLADVSMETLVGSLGKLTKAQSAALKETSQQAKVFDALGISIKNADGSLRESTDVLSDFADKFQALKGSPEAMAAGFAIFGRSFQEMIPLLKDGGDGIRAAGAELEAFGGVLSSEAGNNAEEFNDNLTRLETAAKALAQAVASDLLPDLIDLTNNWIKLAKDGSTLQDTAHGIADIFRVIGGVAEFVGGYFTALDNVIQGVTIGFVGLAEAAKGVINLNWDQVKRGIDVANGGADLAYYGTAPETATARKPRARAGSSRRGGAAMNYTPDYDPSAALRLALEDASKPKGAKKSGGGGKSDAEREAEQLQKSYESLRDSLNETHALFGENTEAAKVLFETQTGGLSALSQARKDELVMLAERNDAQALSAELEKASADRLKEETQSIEAHSKAVKDQIADMEFENKLIGLTDIAKEKEIALRYANVDAMSEEGQKITGLIDEYHKLNDSYGFVNDAIDGLGDAFADFATGAKSAKEAFGDWADDLYATAVQWLADQAMNALKDWLSGKQDGKGGYGGASGSGGGFDWGGFIGNIFSAFGGGKAGGGDVFGNTPYLVGEQGPEMFVPRTAGTILTAGQTAGMGRGGNVMNLNNSFILAAPTSQRTQEQIAQRAGFEVEQAQRRNG